MKLRVVIRDKLSDSYSEEEKGKVTDENLSCLFVRVPDEDRLVCMFSYRSVSSDRL